MKLLILFLIPLQLFSSECRNSEKVIQLGNDKSAELHFDIGAPEDFVRPPRAIKIIPYKNFIIGYSLKYKTPLWAQYRTKNLDLTCKKAFRPPSKFYCDKRVRKDNRLTHDDFKDVSCNTRKPGYDKKKCLARGHLVPSSLFGCNKKDARGTFLTTNIVPQIQNKFNGGVWSSLERRVKKCAREHDLTIITGVNQGEIRKDFKPAIPFSFYKILYDHGSGKTISFLLRNKPHKTAKDFKAYRRSIKDIENITGFRYLVFKKINKNSLGNLQSWKCFK